MFNNKEKIQKLTCTCMSKKLEITQKVKHNLYYSPIRIELQVYCRDCLLFHVTHPEFAYSKEEYYRKLDSLYENVIELFGKEV